VGVEVPAQPGGTTHRVDHLRPPSGERVAQGSELLAPFDGLQDFFVRLFRNLSGYFPNFRGS
jgi:hypothetical protein